MPRNQCIRQLLIAASFFVFAAFPEPILRAKELYVYDLDSLVYMSTDVVEAEITRSYKAKESDLIDVKVALVHKGDCKKGQAVVAAYTGGYRKPQKNDKNAQPLAVGDRVVLFGRRVKLSESFTVPDDAVIYAPLPGGMRLVQDGHVFGFSQWDNPGPYVANVAADPVKAKALTLERFRGKVRDSLRDTAVWARLVEAKPGELDVPRLMKLLEARSKQTDGRDFFTERICIRFAETHDLFVLDEALPLAKDHHDISILHYGFGTPKGRDYLLSKVNDPREPMPARLRYARALHNAGMIYQTTFTEIGAKGYRPVGEADEENSGYITRIAKAASTNRKHKELCGSLVRCIDYFGQGIVQNKPAPLMKDLRAAFGVLKEIYDTKPSEEMQFAIEKATAHDRESFEKLKSPCGDFISILRAVDPTIYTKPAQRSLIFEYDYATSLMSRDAEIQPVVVMIHQGTQKEYVLPTKLRIRGWSIGGGSNSVVLPKELAAGSYRVFLQLREGEKVRSTGHYFVADL